MSTTTENVVYKFDVVADSAVKELDALSKSFSSLETGFKQFGSLTNAFSKSIKRATSSFSGFKKVTQAFSGLAIGKALGEATKEAIDFYETLNLFQVAMKDSIDTGKEFIDNISEWYGLDPATLMQYTGTFYEMAYAVGAPDEAARKLSTSLTALSVDLASLFNVDVDRATDNLTSGLRGMSRAVVKYGLDLRATTVEAFANSKGITAQYETMNEASREILRYAVAITQAEDATGDFARTIKQPANQLRIFKEQVTQLGRAIGTFIVKPLQDALPIVNGFVMAIRTMIETIGSLLGVSLEAEYTTGFENANETVDELGTTADTTKKKLKALLAPFDELNVLQENSGATSTDLGYGTIDPEILKLLDTMEYQLEEVRMKAHDVRDAILGFFGFTPDEGTGWLYSPQLFEENLKRYLPEWTKTIESLFDFNYGALLGNFRLLFYELGTIVADTIGLALAKLEELTGFKITDEGLSSWLDNLNQKFIDFRVWLENNREDIAKFVATGLLMVGMLMGVAAILEPVSQLLFAFGGAAFLASTFFSGLSSVVSLFTTGLSGLFTVLGSIAKFVGGELLTPFHAFGALIALVAAGFITAFARMWENSQTFRDNFSVLWGNFMLLIGEVVTLVKNVVSAIWQILQPAIEFFATVFQGMLIPIQTVIDSVVQIFLGLVEVLNGILTGDMEKVLTGFCRILANLVEAVAGLFATVINGVLGAIRGALNWLGSKIHSFISGVIGVFNAIRSALGFDEVSVPDISHFQFEEAWEIEVPKLSSALAFASGGVVTGPTRALIGEAGRSEAVIPLDNSPQMLDLIDKIAERVNGGETVVKVYIGDREWDAFTYESAQRGKSLVGAKPIKEGRA